MKHFTVSDEVDDKCPYCGTKTVLVVAPHHWSADGDDENEQLLGGVNIKEEITGHYCPNCEQLTSISFNG